MHFANFSISAGGVGRNICEALNKLGSNPIIISAVGNDSQGNYIRSNFPLEVARYIKTVRTIPTAQCTVILDSNGECKLLLGELNIFNEITPDTVSIFI